MLNLDSILSKPTSIWEQRRMKMYENKQTYENIASLILNSIGEDDRGRKSYMAAFDKIYGQYADNADPRELPDRSK